jgi:hypothetical protein
MCILCRKGRARQLCSAHPCCLSTPANVPPCSPATHPRAPQVDVPSLQINRFSLADGLAQLGYAVSDSDIDHLLEQLATVHGVESSACVSKESFAASQLDWETIQADGSEQWETMARAAFDALDLDGDGEVHRTELEIMLVGRCPYEVRLAWPNPPPCALQG